MDANDGKQSVHLSDLVGKRVDILAPKISPKRQLFTVKIHGVETSGLWIEDKILSEIVLQGATMHEATPIFFVPFHMIESVVVHLGVPYISDEIAK